MAGSGIAGYSGDGAPALNAGLTQPSGIAVDAAGNLYIADTGNNCIRKVSGGTISTVAGNGNAGFSGDAGPAGTAMLNLPRSVIVDSTGSLYIADTHNHRIRKVSGGTISTAAGNGSVEFSGDNGPATAAALDFPGGMALDSTGNLYVADTFHHRVRKVTQGTISTVAGNGASGSQGDGGAASNASLFYPEGVVADAQGNLYIADTSNGRIRRVSGTTISTFAGDRSAAVLEDNGAASSAYLAFPQGVASDAAGHLYIADTNDQRIRAIAAGLISTVAGSGRGGDLGDTGPATDASLYYPQSVAVDTAGSLFIADTENSLIRRVTAGTITTIAGTGQFGFTGDGPATTASLNLPSGVAFDSGGNLYIADSANNRIRKLTAGVLTTVAGSENPGFSGDDESALNASFNDQRSIFVDSAGSLALRTPRTIAFARSPAAWLQRWRATESPASQAMEVWLPTPH